MLGGGGAADPPRTRGRGGRKEGFYNVAKVVPSCRVASAGALPTMSTKKQPEVVRRVWRMSADAPAGEYLDLELVPKEASVTGSTGTAPRRTLHPETPPAYRTTHVASDASSQASKAQTTGPREGSPATLRRPATTPQQLPSVDLPPPSARAKVLRPAQVESWQASSFDLLTGCVVRDVTNTIPAKIYEELFGRSEEPLLSLGFQRRRR